MNKKGQGLPLNTIIVAVLVIVVLVVVLIFFLGGMGGMSKKIKSIFFGATAGVDKSLAIEYCRQYCVNAENLPKSAQASSSFCKKYFSIDDDNDGEAEYQEVNGKKVYDRWYCYDKKVESEDGARVRSLDVACAVECKVSNVKKI